MKFEDTIPNGTVNSDKILEAYNTGIAQNEKKLASLRAQIEILQGAYDTTAGRASNSQMLLDVCRKIAVEENVMKRESLIFDLCNILDVIDGKIPA